MVWPIIGAKCYVGEKLQVNASHGTGRYSSRLLGENPDSARNSNRPVTRDVGSRWIGSLLVSVLVSVGLGIQCVLVQPDAPILMAKSFRLQHSAAWCA